MTDINQSNDEMNSAPVWHGGANLAHETPPGQHEGGDGREMRSNQRPAAAEPGRPTTPHDAG